MDKPLLETQVSRSDDADPAVAVAEQPPTPPSQQPHPTRESRDSQLGDEATPEPAAPPLLLIVESLIPVRGHAIEIAALETISNLKARYAQMLWREASAHAALPVSSRATVAGPGAILPGMTEQEYELHIRLVLDGVELADEARIEDCGLTNGMRVIAMDRHQRRGRAWKLLRYAYHWWPALVVALIVGVLVVEGTGASLHLCDRPLLTFILLTAPVLMPYAVVLSGLFQPDTGHRMLWFLHHRVFARVVGFNALFALIWFILGAVWIFSGDSNCPSESPALYATSLVAWLLLAVVNLPWVVLLCLPCMLLCKCAIAFDIIAHMAGRHRRPIWREYQ